VIFHNTTATQEDAYTICRAFQSSITGNLTAYGSVILLVLSGVYILRNNKWMVSPTTRLGYGQVGYALMMMMVVVVVVMVVGMVVVMCNPPLVSVPTAFHGLFLLQVPPGPEYHDPRGGMLSERLLSPSSPDEWQQQQQQRYTTPLSGDQGDSKYESTILEGDETVAVGTRPPPPNRVLGSQEIGV